LRKESGKGGDGEEGEEKGLKQLLQKKKYTKAFHQRSSKRGKVENSAIRSKGEPHGRELIFAQGGKRFEPQAPE